MTMKTNSDRSNPASRLPGNRSNHDPVRGHNGDNVQGTPKPVAPLLVQVPTTP